MPRCLHCKVNTYWKCTVKTCDFPLYYPRKHTYTHNICLHQIFMQNWVWFYTFFLSSFVRAVALTRLVSYKKATYFINISGVYSLLAFIRTVFFLIRLKCLAFFTLHTQKKTIVQKNDFPHTKRRRNKLRMKKKKFQQSEIAYYNFSWFSTAGGKI